MIIFSCISYDQWPVFIRWWPDWQTCAASHQVKSSQVKVMTLTFLFFSKKSNFFSKSQKSHSHDFDFFRYFDSKKGPNCPKVKCKILTKWPFGTKRKRQNVFSRSPSKKFKVIFLTFFRNTKKVKVMTWLLDDLTLLFLKKLTIGASLQIGHKSLKSPEYLAKCYQEIFDINNFDEHGLKLL